MARIPEEELKLVFDPARESPVRLNLQSARGAVRNRCVVGRLLELGRQPEPVFEFRICHEDVQYLW